MVGSVCTTRGIGEETPDRGAIGRPLKIGSLELTSNLLLAPIAGYCDLAFRLTCRSFNDDPAGEQGGLGLACTDLLSPHGLLKGTARSLDLAKTNDEDRPIGMQLYGSDPSIMGEGAAWAVEHGASLVDINMGCPVDKITKKDGGSKLLCDPDRALRIVESVRTAVDRASNGRVPTTIKTRLGWFDDEPVAEWLAPKLIEAGAMAVTLHGRTTAQKFRGHVDLPGIRRVVEAIDGRAPVIGNGDVKEPEDALRMIEATGCDGVMIGRGALSTPWLFRDAWTLQRRGSCPDCPELHARIELVRRFLELMRKHRGDRGAMIQMRRRISWFAKRLGPCRPLREAVRLAEDPESVHRALDAFLGGNLQPAPCRDEQGTGRGADRIDQPAAGAA